MHVLAPLRSSELLRRGKSEATLGGGDNIWQPAVPVEKQGIGNRQRTASYCVVTYMIDDLRLRAGFGLLANPRIQGLR